MGTKARIVGVYGFALHEVIHRRLMGVLRYCNEVGGFTVRDFRTFDVIDHDGKVLSPQWKGRCDGVVVCSGRHEQMNDTQTADWVLSGDVCAVSTGADWTDPRIPAIYTDVPSLATMAADYLRGCDCRSYLHVGFAGSTGSSLRGECFRKSLAQQRCVGRHYAAKCQLLGTSYDEAAISRETDLIQLLTTLPKPLGVWALSDIYAAAICALCRRLGLRIPEEVRVLGTNDTELARSHAPSLSSIRTPGERIGYLAAKTLHRLLDGKKAKGVEVPAEELVIRESTSTHNSLRGTIDDALLYIERHACSNITIDQIAQKLGMSRRTFFAHFQQQVGCSPRQEIQRVRLATAQELLEHEELSITRIAALVGFAETAAFSKFFTKHVGLSPRQYREQKTKKRRG